MNRILRLTSLALAVAVLGGCVVAPIPAPAPAYGYSYAPGYEYAPGYAYAPPVAVGFGFGFRGHRHWR